LLRDAALTNEAGQVNTYVQSEDSAMPVKKWVLIPLKGEEVLEKIPLYRQEWYLFGKDRDIAHVPTDHPSCSRQHAVVQYRRRVVENEFGERVTNIVPYVRFLILSKMLCNSSH
jgi:smad nuclear-interacting protein 1